TVTALIEELDSLKSKEQSLKEKKEIYEFQINEISSVNPQLGEEEELIQEEKILRNSEKLYQLTNDLYQRLYEAEGSAIEIFSEATEKLVSLAEIDSQFENYKQDCQSAQIIIEEISKFLQSYNTNIAFEPERLEEIRERLAHFSGLKKKYGGSIGDILKHKEKIESELSLIENLDDKIKEKTSEIEAEKKVLLELCLNLSIERKRASEKLQRSVEEALTHLGMSRAKFEILIERHEDPDGLLVIDGKRCKVSPRGIDQVEFLLSANPGEEPKPLVKVASGGEVSRIMLALKTALAEADKIPVLIFDEIDIGISGRIAQAVGKSLKNLAKTHQVICITHLPQIASMSDHHFVVEKYSGEERTFTKIRKLQPEERPLEIAKLLGGEQVTETHIKSAKELIDQVNQK
ncbi:DNA repair protein RecN, partial [candidate division KSB1 bacterium]|nr:DNA repair protein RecN [candidate division KSB1 bacterium]